MLSIAIGCSSPSRQEHKQTENRDTTVVTPSKPMETPLLITVAFPEQNHLRPNVDSNFIFGNVNDPKAALTINGKPVALTTSGAFLAFLPNPKDRYTLVATNGSRSDTSILNLVTPQPAANPSKSGEPPAPITTPTLATIIKGSDTLATGSDVAVGSPTPEADRRWFFPKKAMLTVTGRQGNLYKVALDPKTTAWVADTNLQLGAVKTSVTQPALSASIAGQSFVPGSGYTDVALPVSFAPFLVETGERDLKVTIYGRTAPKITNFALPQAALLQSFGWQDSNGDAQLRLGLARYFWGYKAFYREDGALVIRVRFAPHMDPAEPVKGLTIVVDPGHPPGGAIGPLMLTEAEANLAIGTRIAEKLRARGANVLLTHTTTAGLKSSTNQLVELNARLEFAIAANADLLLSVHNNAFPEGTNPFNNYGTGTYYFHPFSAPLAQALIAEIDRVTNIPNDGARQRSLALVRSTWMPSTLTESLYMMFPDQEAKLRDVVFLDRLAEAHVRGIEQFLHSRLETP